MHFRRVIFKNQSQTVNKRKIYLKRKLKNMSQIIKRKNVAT